MKKYKPGRIALLRCLATVLALVLASGAPAGVSAGGMSGTPSVTLYADRILNGKSVQDVRIDLAEADLSAMLASPLEETYYPATVNIGGLTVTEVGLRTKGNSSLNQVARSESDRFSLKLDFNRYVQGQDLLGLTMLNLNNCMADPSYMREYLSYKILGQAGVPVPAFSYTNVYINGKLWGFYLAVEGIADPFLERWYGTAEGALYKPEGVGSDLVYKSDDAATYTGMTLESHPQYDNGERLVALLKALDTTGGPVDKARLEEILDVDEVLRYWAAQTVVINLDGYQGVMLHNYYLYEVDGRFSVIPWDFNMSFAGFSASVSADGGYLYIDTPVAGTTMAARPLINTLLSDKAYLERYRGYLRELVEGVFSEKSMQAQITGLTEMIGPYVKADPTSFFTYEKFLSAVDPDAAATVPDRSAEVPGAGGMDGNVVALMSFVRVWNANITAQLAGDIPSTGTVSSSMGGRNPGGAVQFPNMAAPDGVAGRFPGGAPPDGFLPGGALPDGFLPGGANDANVQQRDPAGKAEPATRRMASSMPTAELVMLAAAGLTLLVVTLVLWRRKNLHAV